MFTHELKIDGMTCQHCVMSLKEALGRIERLNVKNVEIGSATVEYEAGKVTEEQLETAVNKAGFNILI
jgi:copper chaperone CopZ